MSDERRVLVRLGGGDAARARDLRRSALAARERAELAPAGEREDVVRFEQVCAQIEHLATVALLAGADSVGAPPAPAGADVVFDADRSPGGLSGADARTVATWQRGGDVAVELRLAFASGPTPPPAARDPRPVARVWRAQTARSRQEAVQERFEQQLERVCRPAAQDGAEPAAVRPGSVPNRALTEGLRTYAATRPGSAALAAPVVYGDGSRAADFPLRAVALSGAPVPDDGARVLRVALLSVRHVAMDHRVDGAWLRNRDISRPRPGADTDRIAHEESQRQLERLCRDGPVTLEMFQTGLEPAVVAFYRAVVAQLARAPRSLRVVPRYYEGDDADYGYGTPWWVGP